MKKTKAIIDKREFVRRYMESSMIRPADDETDPRPKIMKLLQHGRESEIIAEYDPDQKGPLRDHRVYNFVVHAHVQAGSLKRGKELAELAIKHFRSVGDTQFEAIALVGLARIVFRTKGLKSALLLLNKALEIDPLCRTAITNRLCYASLDGRSDLLREFLVDLEGRILDFHKQDFYRTFFAEDAQIDYLRSLDIFESIANKLDI